DRFQPGDQFFVFYVKGVLDMALRQAIGAARKRPIVRHQGADRSGREEVGIEEKSVVSRQLRIAMIKLISKGVLELAARSPQKLQPKFPCGLSLGVKRLRFQFQ